MKVCLLHMKIRNTLTGNLSAASKEIFNAAKHSPAFVALPEYFSVPGCMENFTSAAEICKETHDSTISFLQRSSEEIADIYLLGGTVIEEDGGRFYNTSTLWRNGMQIAKYRKINPISGERKAGVAKGHEPVVVNTDFCKVGLLVCADMFDPLLVKRIADLGSEMVYLPVAAMGTHPSVKGHPLTEKVAAENGIFVLKVGNVCSSTKGGRSAIVAPWGTVAEVSDSPKDTIIVFDLDMQKLREYRKQFNKAYPNTQQSESFL